MSIRPTRTSTAAGQPELAARTTPDSGLDTERLAKLAKVSEQLTKLTAEAAEATRADLKDRDFTASLGRNFPDVAKQLPDIAKAIDADADLDILRAKQFAEAVVLIQRDQEKNRTQTPIG